MQNENDSHSKWLFPLLLAGIIVRLVPYLYNRALWLDEANLANAIRELSFTQLTGPLPYDQAAPIGFLWLEKITILLLGDSEFSLRLIPLLFSIGTLFLFYAFAKQIFQNNFSLFALAFFAFCPPLVYYASEVKQYGLDVFACLIILLLTLRCFKAPLPQKRIFLLALAGAMLVWFSQPIVFVLAGSGISILSHQWKLKKINWSSLFSLAIPWGISFGIYYFAFLKPTITTDNLQSYHVPYFMPFQFWKAESLLWYWDTIFNVFRNPAGIFLNYLATPIALLGSFIFFKKHRPLWILLSIPLLLAFIASGLHLYSTIPRLLLFGVPILLVLVVKGIECLYEQFQHFPKGGKLKYAAITLGFVLLLQPFLNTAIHNMTGIEVEEIKTSLATIKTNQQPTDRIFVYSFAAPAFKYYQDQFDFKNTSTTPLKNLNKQWQTDFKTLKKGQRFWLLFSHHKVAKGHYEDRDYLKYINLHAAPLLKKEAKGTVCYLYQWN